MRALLSRMAIVAVGMIHAVATAQTSAPSSGADLIVFNAKVHTVDEAKPTATAFAVKDGKFVAVGSDAEINAAPHKGRNTKMIDAQGRTIIPGLNDSHAHAIRGARFYNLELRWDPPTVDSLERALAMVREQAARTPQGPPQQWVRVIGGWSPFQFKEMRMPTIAELNQAAPDTPVFVLYLYSQGFINAAAVKTLGWDQSPPPNPDGGRFEWVDGGAILHADPNPLIFIR